MRTQRWLLLSWTVASSSTSVALSSSSVQSLFIANKERTCHRFPRRHHSTVPPVIHRCERTCKSSSVSLVGDDEHHCDDTNDGEVIKKGHRLVDSNDGTTRGHHERDRRAVLAALLLVSSSSSAIGVAAHPNPASADDGGFFGGDTAPAAASAAMTTMDGLSRRIRTSIVRGARLIDRADGAWERFSDDFGLGVERNRPRKVVVDAGGGNAATRRMVKSESESTTTTTMDGGGKGGAIIFDDTFALGVLRRCDEVRETASSDARILHVKRRRARDAVVACLYVQSCGTTHPHFDITHHRSTSD